jgi:hypothetical protein
MFNALHYRVDRHERFCQNVFFLTFKNTEIFWHLAKTNKSHLMKIVSFEKQGNLWSLAKRLFYVLSKQKAKSMIKH